DPQALKLFAEILEHVYLKHGLEEGDDQEEVSNIDAEIALESLINNENKALELDLKSAEGFDEACEFWNEKASNEISVKKDKYETCIQLANMNYGDEISISQDKIFDKIRHESCYRNYTDLEVERKK
ncbi:7551_t:CDS:2, partial [Racocetra fulgida]